MTADISESMSQLSGSIHRAQDDMGSLQQLTLGMRDEIAVPVWCPSAPVYPFFGVRRAKWPGLRERRESGHFR